MIERKPKPPRKPKPKKDLVESSRKAIAEALAKDDGLRQYFNDEYGMDKIRRRRGEE